MTRPCSPSVVRAQVQLLRTLLATIADLDQAIGTRLAPPSQGRPAGPTAPHRPASTSPNCSPRSGPILDRASSAEHAAAEAGAAPVTRASGKTSSVHFRWAANTEPARPCTTFADNTRHSSPWAAKLYADARARGKRHPHAIRILARAWLRVIWACWHTDTPYDPAKHRAEQRLAA